MLEADQCLGEYFSFSQLWNLGIIFDLPCVLTLDQCIITAVPSAEIGPSFSQHSRVSHHLIPQINSNFLLSNTENCHFALLVSSENNTVKRIFLPSLQTMSFLSNTALLSPLFTGHIKPKLVFSRRFTTFICLTHRFSLSFKRSSLTFNQPQCQMEAAPSPPHPSQYS